MKAFMDKRLFAGHPHRPASVPRLFRRSAHHRLPLPHSSPEIYEDRRFENIAQVWLGGHQVLADGSDSYFGDHYKWRVMRSNGVPEEYITGDKPDRERFPEICRGAGDGHRQPDVHLVPPELKKYFGYEGVLNGETAEKCGTSATTSCSTIPR